MMRPLALRVAALVVAVLLASAGCASLRPVEEAPPAAISPIATPSTMATHSPTATPSPAADAATPLVAEQAAGAVASPLFSEDFEGDAGRWELGEGATIAGEGRDGGRAARLENASLRTVLDTAVGRDYKVTFWVQVVAETGQDWGGLRGAAESWDWAMLGYSEYLSSPAGEWRQAAFIFRAATTRTHLTLGYFGGPERTIVARVDDVAVWPQGSDNAAPQVSARVAVDAEGTLRYAAEAADADGTIARVNWTFGDGGRAFDLQGDYPVLAAGAYTATVQVADDEGAVASAEVPWAWAGLGPALSVAEPADGAQVDTPRLALRGTAGADVAAVRVSSDGGQLAAAELDGAGGWAAEIELAPGDNRLLVQAETAAHAVVAHELRVRYVPAGALAVAEVAAPDAVRRWEVAEITFQVENSAAGDPQLPYDPESPAVSAGDDGISVDALFTPDGWRTVYTRPAFLAQPMQRAEKGGEEWLYPQGEPAWTVRFAPPAEGEWRYRIEVREARGQAVSAEGTLTVTAADEGQHGPVRVSAADPRYFEYADGTPFLGNGTNIGLDAARYSYDADVQFAEMGSGNVELVRWWIGGQVWGAAWRPWNSLTLDFDGYLPASGLTTERAYGDAVAALRLDAANPVMLHGWNSGHAALIPGRRYRLAARWRTEGVTGPRAAGEAYGVTLKFADWPTPGTTGDLPALVAPVHGDTPWHVAAAEFTAEGDLLPNLALIMENTTGGAAYVDEVWLQEIMADGSVGPQLLPGSRFGDPTAYDERRAAGIDSVLSAAAERGVAVKLVIGEKNDPLLGLLAGDGLVDPQGGHYAGDADTPMGWLHRAYWRYLMARYGAYSSVHSWELVNEGDPGSQALFSLAADLAVAAAADGNPHPASTSTWAGLADLWADPANAALGYIDFHAGARGNGWLGPAEELAADSAAYTAAYDAAAATLGAAKPVVWGEQSIAVDGDPDREDPALAADVAGVWLHKMVWARCGPGGVYPLYWFTDSIRANGLYGRYGAWNRFMADVPLNNGRYQDAAAEVDGDALRVLGQKDLAASRAHLWIDNRGHTWAAVVEGDQIATAEGTVAVAMGRPGAAYTLTWYDTDTGLPTRSATVHADAEGRVRFTVEHLATDTAVQLAPAGA